MTADSNLPAPVDLVISPAPTEDETAAIVAAYRELWPHQVEQAAPADSSRWRFSGRWWMDLPRRGALR